MKIYYFTRSGRSKTIADQLAAREGAEAERIDDHKNWQGRWNYMKAAVLAMSGKTLSATYKKPAAGEQVTVVFPIWAGSMPPAVKTFVSEVGRKNVICIPTSLGSKLKDRAEFAKIIDLVGDPIAPPEKL